MADHTAASQMPEHSAKLDFEALLKEDYTYFDISPRTGFLDCENTAQSIPRDLPEHEWEGVLLAASGLQLRDDIRNPDEQSRANVWRDQVHKVSSKPNSQVQFKSLNLYL